MSLKVYLLKRLAKIAPKKKRNKILKKLSKQTLISNVTGTNSSIYSLKNRTKGTISIQGDNNTFEYHDPKHKLIVNATIKGNNNKIIIGKKFNTESIKKTIISDKTLVLNLELTGDNNQIMIENNVDGFLDILMAGMLTLRNCSCLIGENTHIGHPTKMEFAESNTSIEIGQDCMFSERINFWCSDSHSVIDLETGSVINKAKSIIIGNHVWVARDVSFNKNTKVSDNSLVAHNSIVTKQFNEKNIIIAGIPAKKRKENINWSWLSPDAYEEQKEDIINDKS